ncbi:MAG: prolyl-tRNA synthetase [Candidatus Doudnabacteria bacterium]|nr:prolyl-tRNA synthetase [Candidatus Doudnabacteria bacterium]
MRQSQLFGKTSKTAPSDDPSVNARLLERGGFVQKVMAGVYSYLPLGLRVLQKIENVVRQEMNAIGGQEIFMPSLHPKESWVTTGRWSGLDVLFKIKSRHGHEYALGPSHEEVVTPMARPIISSYKDLPFAVYQIQTKFRDEPRVKSGLLRGREFRMKDMYSFHADAADLNEFYERASAAYLKTFKRIGLDAIRTEATGGTFSEFSDEFQIEIPTGEDTIYICKNCEVGKNKEIFSERATCSRCKKNSWRASRGSEVGNIFKLKPKYASSFDLIFTDKAGKKQIVIMGCYGIGISRLMGVLVEKFHDEKGVIWPEIVAPFFIHLVSLDGGQERVGKFAEEIWRALQKQGHEVLYDDRELSPGTKLADSDLLGIPLRLVVSPRTVERESVEYKLRAGQKTQLEKERELSNYLSKL